MTNYRKIFQVLEKKFRTKLFLWHLNWSPQLKKLLLRNKKQITAKTVAWSLKEVLTIKIFLITEMKLKVIVDNYEMHRWSTGADFEINFSYNR